MGGGLGGGRDGCFGGAHGREEKKEFWEKEKVVERKGKFKKIRCCCYRLGREERGHLQGTNRRNSVAWGGTGWS